MKTVNIQAAKTHLSRLVEEAAAGEEIILAKAGKPLAKLVPFAMTRKRRIGGLLKGQVWMSPNCWEPDEALNKLMTEGPLTTDAPDDVWRVAEEGPKP
jgi:prevent-host-death family protein